jgi:hypothetical protein
METWGQQSAKKFTDRVFYFLELLFKYPRLGSVEDKEFDIRGFTLSKQTRLLYKVQ